LINDGTLLLPLCLCDVTGWLVNEGMSAPLQLSDACFQCVSHRSLKTCKVMLGGKEKMQ